MKYLLDDQVGTIVGGYTLKELPPQVAIVKVFTTLIKEDPSVAPEAGPLLGQFIQDVTGP